MVVLWYLVIFYWFKIYIFKTKKKLVHSLKVWNSIKFRIHTVRWWKNQDKRTKKNRIQNKTENQKKKFDEILGRTSFHYYRIDIDSILSFTWFHKMHIKVFHHHHHFIFDIHSSRHTHIHKQTLNSISLECFSCLSFEKWM